MNMKNEISVFIKEKRKELGLTQVQLAFYSGVGLAFIRAIEQGKTNVQVDNVNKVLKLFNAELAPKEMKK